jgi:hypothetical protein
MTECERSGRANSLQPKAPRLIYGVSGGGGAVHHCVTVCARIHQRVVPAAMLAVVSILASRIE